jgi:hypothetical protein
MHFVWDTYAHHPDNGANVSARLTHYHYYTGLRSTFQTHYRGCRQSQNGAGGTFASRRSLSGNVDTGNENQKDSLRRSTSRRGTCLSFQPRLSLRACLCMYVCVHTCVCGWVGAHFFACVRWDCVRVHSTFMYMECIIACMYRFSLRCIPCTQPCQNIIEHYNIFKYYNNLATRVLITH